VADDREPSADEDPESRTVGRYVIGRPIGRGGSGQVFAAFDTVLDRNVALKQLWDHSGSTDDIVREGRLLARLSHPSVVTIHDIAFGEDDEVFLAMELVDGEDFAAWAERHRTDDAAALQRVLREVGSGLAFAHAAGIVHGDVKPANILIDRQDHARVTDFGVARIVDTNVRPATAEGWTDDGATLPCGAGTPAYMAPEQHAGDPAGPAADQYSFCLTAWEALTGEYPFQIDEDARDLAVTFSGGLDATGPLTHPLERLADQKRTWRAPAKVRTLPDRWGVALRRGLLPDPAERFASMEALLAALDPPRRRRWPYVVGAAGLAGLAVAGWVSAFDLGARCQGADAALGDAWDDATRTGIEAAILGTGLDYAPAVWTEVSADLDDYARQWVAGHTDACEASAIHHEQSETLMGLRMACLDRARTELTAVTHVLRELDDTSLPRAHRVVAGLPPIAHCAEVASLQGDQAPPSPAEAEAVASLRAAIARSKSLHRAGRVPEAHEVMVAAAAQAKAVAYEPVHVEVLVELAIVQEKNGEYEPAKATFAEAAKLATKVGMSERALRAQRGLLYVVASRLHDPKQAQAYLHIVEGLVEREGNQTADRAELASDRALLAFETADYEASVAFQRESVALFEEAMGPRALSPIYGRRKVAGTLRNMGEYEAAETEFRQLVALQTDWLGAEHPEVLETRCDLAQVLFRQGKYAESEAELRATLPPQEKILGVGHPVMLMYRATLAEALAAQDRNDEAEAEFRTALKNMGDGPGPAPELRNGLGNLLEHTDRLEEAEAEFRLALAAFEATLGPEHPNVAISKHNLANILARRGDYAGATAQNLAAIELLNESLGPEHPQVGLLHLNFGRMYNNEGKFAEAKAQVELGLAVLDKALGPEHPQTVEGHELLGRIEGELRG
jgi:tetratricopeptide (TPR) repeat protein